MGGRRLAGRWVRLARGLNEKSRPRGRLLSDSRNAYFFVSVVVVVALPVPAGVFTVVDLVVSVVLGEVADGVVTVVDEEVEVEGGVSAGFTSTFVVLVVGGGEDGVTSALQPASATASRAAIRYDDFIVRVPCRVGDETRH
jgi:hypothetical protein